MNSNNDLKKRVATAVREYGMYSVLLRNATSRKLGLNITDMECLSLLSITGISTPTELARYTGLTTGSTTAMLDRLEKAKLITRLPNPNDRRGLLIEINKKSKERIAAMFGGIQETQNELIADYSDEDLEIIAYFLARYTENLIKFTEIVEEETIFSNPVSD